MGSILRSLSGRLLLVTILFVMLAEVLIFVPSLARFRMDYLSERLAAANLAAIAMLEDERGVPAPVLEGRLLSAAEVRSVAIRRDGARIPVLYGDWTEEVEESFDLDRESIAAQIGHSLTTLVGSADPERVIRVIGMPPESRNPLQDTIEITLRESQLRNAMISFGGRVALLSLTIAVVSAFLVFLVLNRWLVRPIRRVIANMMAFRAAPETAAIITAGAGRTEIAEAETELASMQTEVRSALRQKTRLAALGEAVAKINHDLRNMLATAQLLTDRLERSADPMVARTAPKLLRSLDRATSLCERTLTFGAVEEPVPERRRVILSDLLEEVRDEVVAPEGVSIVIDAPPDAFAEADPEQLFRIVANLTRNAVQALSASRRERQVTLSARREGEAAVIEVADTGPGLPAVARENLFKAFKGSVRKGGTGLGLAIAQELAQGHGGRVELVESTVEGTRFAVTIPDMNGG